MNTVHETVLEIDFKALSDNLDYLKSKLKASTKVIAVVKAYAYGHGDIMLGKKLEELGVAALWVADFEEGSHLRENGIKIPIIVANPGRKSTAKILQHKLDVVVYNFELLHLFGALATDINIHIKFNTGMNRFGFEAKEVVEVSKVLKQYPTLKVKSICSHLAASDNPDKDILTQQQFLKFDVICTDFNTQTGLKPLRHILNSNGVLRFNDKSYEMVRLGIGLYGGSNHPGLKQIGTLKSVISQIRTVKKGQTIGYDASYTLKQDTRVGVIPFGYADGLNRRFGMHKGIVFIEGKPCPIIGRISMDSCTIDLSNTTAQLGDEVILFGKEYTICALAQKIETIPYEIFATLNRRIKRVYSS